MSPLVSWQDDSPYEHGEPLSVRAALGWGFVILLVALLVVVRGGAALVVGFVS